MKLFVETQKVQSATVPVRWCITKTEKQRLLEKGIDPALALVLMSVVNGGQEVDRLVVPLDQMMAYVAFRKPGKNVIKTVIVYRADANKERTTKLRADLLNRAYHVLTGDLNFESATCLDSWLHQSVQLVDNSVAEAEVFVDQQFFAKKPRDWAWANFWYETKPADQCQLRRRRFLAYTIQPILTAAWYFIIAPVVKIIVTLALLLWGIRPAHVGWKALWFLEPVSDVSCDVRWRSDWTRYKRDTATYQERNRPWWWFFFKPLWLVLVIAAVILAVTGITGLPLTLMVIVLSAFIAAVGLVIIALAAALGQSLLAWLWAKIVRGDLDEDQWSERRRQLRLEAEEATKRRVAEMRQKRLSPLACDSDLSFEPTLAALPPEKRTFHLRFWNFKAKVCRPFPA